MKKCISKLILSIIFTIIFQTSFGQSGSWVWLKGDNVGNPLGNNGTMGVASPNNEPSGRYQSAYWLDLQGNFWVFGGVGGNDELWKYSPITNNWTWIRGNSGSGTYGTMGIPSVLNNPPNMGYGSNCWTDNNGDLWLFGGYDMSNFGTSDDLWRYHIATNEWTWIKGNSSISNPAIYGSLGIAGSTYTPGARQECKSGWLHNNKLWLFGGQDGSSVKNDLWSYDIATNEWAWEGGSQIYSSGNYGTKGITSPTNEPPSRCSYTKWKDGNNNLYLFAGGDFDITSNYSLTNDVWKYNLTTKLWTWISGTNLSNNLGTNDPYCLPNINSCPQSRIENQTAQTNSSCTHAFWSFGGFDIDGIVFHNDLWLFNTDNLEWTKVKGTSGNPPAYNYGTKGVPSSTNLPPGKGGTCVWTDNIGHLYVFGGFADYGNSYELTNDFWKFIPDTACIHTGLVGSANLVAPSDTTICFGDTIKMYFPQNSTITINPTVNTNINTSTGFIEIYNNATTTYTVMAQSLIANDPCFTGDTISFTITGEPAPNADFMISPEVSNIDNPTFNFVNTSSNAVSYEWYYQGLLISTSKDIVQTFPTIGKHCLTLVAINSCGQKSTKIKCCEVVENGMMTIPNAFSPNGDAKNDIFKPLIYGNVTINSFAIFNRWGMKLYETFDQQKAFWNGQYLGRYCELGTYFYLIDAVDGSGHKLFYKGDINLIK